MPKISLKSSASPSAMGALTSKAYMRNVGKGEVEYDGQSVRFYLLKGRFSKEKTLAKEVTLADVESVTLDANELAVEAKDATYRYVIDDQHVAESMHAKLNELLKAGKETAESAEPAVQEPAQPIVDESITPSPSEAVPVLEPEKNDLPQVETKLADKLEPVEPKQVAGQTVEQSASAPAEEMPVVNESTVEEPKQVVEEPQAVEAQKEPDSQPAVNDQQVAAECPSEPAAPQNEPIVPPPALQESQAVKVEQTQVAVEESPKSILEDKQVQQEQQEQASIAEAQRPVIASLKVSQEAGVELTISQAAPQAVMPKAVAYPPNEYMHALRLALPVVDSLFDILKGMHGHIRWNQIVDLHKGLEKSARAFNKSVPDCRINLLQLSKAVKEHDVEAIPKEAYRILEAVYDYFESLNVEASRQAKLAAKLYYLVNDAALASAVDDDNADQEVVRLQTVISGLPAEDFLQFKDTAKSVSALRIEDDKLVGLEQCRDAFRLQLEKWA